jgi:transposase InsO family protein
MEVVRPNQVWAMDITYIPMAKDFVYLAVVLDWLAAAPCRLSALRPLYGRGY